MTSPSLRAVASLLALVVAGTTSACSPDAAGTSTTRQETVVVPRDAVPALAARLADVDAAMAARDWPAAMRALTAVERLTARAEASGALTSEQTDRILAAASRLGVSLPTPTPAPEDPAPTPRVTTRDGAGSGDGADRTTRRSADGSGGTGDRSGPGKPHRGASGQHRGTSNGNGNGKAKGHGRGSGGN